jgi:Gpi18-like mannosyltransferase
VQPRIQKEDERGLLMLLFVGLTLRLASVLLFSGAHFDIDSYRIVAKAVQNFQNIYIVAPNRYPYFPGWAAIELLSLILSQAIPIPFDVLIRIPGIIADTGVILLLYMIVNRGYAKVSVSPLRTAALHTINPVAIMVIGAHGMFDSIPILSMLLCGFLLFEKQPRLAGLVLGLGIVIKQVPLLFGLLFLIMCRSNRSRVEFAFLSALPTALLSIPFLIKTPIIYVSRTIGFQPGPLLGWYRQLTLIHYELPGVTLGRLGVQIADSWEVIQAVNTPILVVPVILWVSYMYSQNIQSIDVWVGVFISILAFYTVSAGLAVEYLYWIMPFLPLVAVNDLWKKAYIAILLITGASWYIWLEQMELKYVDVLHPIFGIDPQLVSLYIFAVSNFAFWLLSLVGIIICLRYYKCAGQAVGRLLRYRPES